MDAKYLAGQAGVRCVTGGRVTQVHFACAGHELVLANGVWCETLYARTVEADEAMWLFPAKAVAAGPPARRVLRRHEARLIAGASDFDLAGRGQVV